MKPLLAISTRLGTVTAKLRGKLLKGWLGAMGTDCEISFGVSFAGHDGIRLGDRCFVARHVDMIAGGGPGCQIDVGNDVRIREGCYLDSHGGWIRLADKVFLGPQCLVYGHGGLSVGQNTMIAGQTVIIPANHVFDRTDIPLREQGESRKGIEIGENVWIGAHCVILDGVHIGHDAVIGAGSIVLKDIPPYAIAAGNPARVVRMRAQKNAQV